jgi:putative endonuclease
MKGFFVSNMFYIYIIKSLTKGIYYKGISEDFQRRLEQHNKGLSQFTSTAMPWELVYVEKHETKRTALIREKKLKKSKTVYIEWLINQQSNLLKNKLPSFFPIILLAFINFNTFCL